MGNSKDKHEKWIPLQLDGLDVETMTKLTAIIDKLPKLPVHVQEIIRIVSDYESDSKDIAKLASSDPVLASKILNEVNSAYYGLSKKTDNLRLAIVLLGYGEVQKIALRCGVFDVLGEGGSFKGYSTFELWKHSYLVSICAETFESNHDSNRAGVLLTLGLLHDIGKFVLVNFASAGHETKIVSKNMSGSGQARNILSKEEKLFGVHHAIIGSILLREWGLPEHFSDIIEYHHYPSFFEVSDVPREIVKEVTIVSISDYLVNLYTGQKNIMPEPSETFLNICGITPPLKDMLTSELQEKLDKAKQFLTYIS